LTDLIEAMRGRILGFNVSTAHVWAEQQHQFQAAGKPMPVEDSYIAAIARRHNLTVVTGNVKDFQRPGVKGFRSIYRYRRYALTEFQQWNDTRAVLGNLSLRSLGK
jgi:hypothetical protein